MAYLEVLAGENAGQCIDLIHGVRIGRHVDNDLCLSSASTSRYHARIVRDGSRYLLEDLNSHNGTELCGIRIPPDTSFELTSGDVITIGASRLCFYESKEAVQQGRLLLAPCEQPIVAPLAVAQDTSTSSSHTRMLQLTDEALACPLTIITRDASLDLHQIIAHQPHTPQEIQQIYRRLQAICQINATLGTTTDFPAMTAILLDCLLEIYPKAERVFVFLSTPEQAELVPFATKIRVKASVQSDEPILSHTIVNTVKTQKCALLSHNVLEDPRFNTQDSIIAHGIRSLMCAPILIDDDFFGVIQLDSCSGMMAFTSDDLEIIAAIVAQLSLVIKQIRLVTELKCEIEQRRVAESILHKSEMHYRSLTEAAPVGVYRTDLQGLYLYVNELWSTMAGLPSQKALDSSWIQAIHADDRERVCAKWSQAVQSQSPFQAEYRFHHLDGTVKWVYGQAVPEKSAEGAVSGYVGTITDITERKQAETEREQLQQKLINFSRQAGMAELATSVLHNVGNILNSINVSASLLTEHLKTSSIDSLVQANALIQTHADDLDRFLTQDPRGKHFPAFFQQLADKLQAEEALWANELDTMVRNIDHIKEIVSMQQSYAQVSGVMEAVSLETLAEDALRAIDMSLEHHGIELVKAFSPLPAVLTDKHKVLQILVNLLTNAKQALGEPSLVERRLMVRIFEVSSQRVAVEVSDTGVGISKAHLSRIFEYGFTTKKDGHGFGLHSCGLMAKELGGELTVQSEGIGCGATFQLTLPCPETDRP